MKKISILLLFQFTFFTCLFAQIDAGLFRYPDVSATQVVFTYANDIWVIPKAGGLATKLSSPAGVELFPKFSPDGKSIAYTANYDGNRDVYTLPLTGGIPVRVTQHSYMDRLVDWTNDGKQLLFCSNRESGKNRFTQFYTISANGGAAEKLPLAYADFGSYSPDGKQMALTFSSQAFRNWKRYRGGSNADIHIFNFEKQTSENITTNEEAGNEFPMWHGSYIYFLTDRGKENRMNLWRYNVSSKGLEQLTTFTDYDMHFPSMGPNDIVFEQAGKIMLYQLEDGKLKELSVTVINDNALLKPKTESVASLIQYTGISPDGNRVLMQARGDVFSLPAKDGAVKNLTMSSGVAERYPSWSPDGKSIAYWSDESGEYELYIKPANGGTAKKITSYGPGYRYHAYWSPDSKKIAFIDKSGAIKIVELSSGIKCRQIKGCVILTETWMDLPATGAPTAAGSLTGVTWKTGTRPFLFMTFKTKNHSRLPVVFIVLTLQVLMQKGSIFLLLLHKVFNHLTAILITHLFILIPASWQQFLLKKKPLHYWQPKMIRYL